MNVIVADLAVLDAADLHALRLGAQVMRHRAEVEARPRVAAFFAALAAGVEFELARRAQEAELLTGSVTLTFAEHATRPDEPDDERRSLLESLALLSGNARLPPQVRSTVGVIRERLLRTN